MHTNSIKSQYKSSGHLDTRIQFHQRFSTNETSWFEWYFNEIALSTDDKVLDVGCGTASFWAVNAEQIPSGVKLVLVDASSGMIETAKKNLTETKNRCRVHSERHKFPSLS